MISRANSDAVAIARSSNVTDVPGITAAALFVPNLLLLPPARIATVI
jgi:hypothetical protein